MTYRSMRPLLGALVVVGSLSLSAWPIPSHAQTRTGICHIDCFSDFTACLAATSGCRVQELTECRDGSSCSNGGCADGTRCPRTLTPECIPCMTARATCLTSCDDTYLPELFNATFKAKLDPDIQRALLAEVAAAEHAMGHAHQQAAQHLKVYRSLVRALSRKTISDATVAGLDEVARRSAATLQSDAVAACVSTLTSVGEGVFVSK